LHTGLSKGLLDGRGNGEGEGGLTTTSCTMMMAQKVCSARRSEGLRSFRSRGWRFCVAIVTRMPWFGVSSSGFSASSRKHMVRAWYVPAGIGVTRSTSWNLRSDIANQSFCFRMGNHFLILSSVSSSFISN
jgi:hypothetical protein